MTTKKIEILAISNLQDKDTSYDLAKNDLKNIATNAKKPLELDMLFL
jgi:hypothetical protein